MCSTDQGVAGSRYLDQTCAAHCGHGECAAGADSDFNGGRNGTLFTGVYTMKRLCASN